MSNKFEELSFQPDDIERLGCMSRRDLIKFGLGATALAADLTVTDYIEDKRNYVQVDKVSDASDSAYRYESWMVLPGFKTGWEGSRWVAESLKSTMAERGAVSYVGYSNKGLDIDEVTEAIDHFAKKQKIRKLHLYGHSFGGMVSVDVAEKLSDHSSLEIDAIVPDSSPANFDDIYEQAEVEWLSRCYDANIHIPQILRGCLEVGERTFNKDERTWGQVFRQSARELTPGAPSTTLILSEAAYIRRFELAEHAIDPAIRFAMLANMEDKTVNIGKSTRRWSQQLKEAYMQTYWTHGATPAHASPFWNKEIYNKRLRRAQERLLPTDKNRYIPYQYIAQ